MHWRESYRADPAVLPLVDRHYNRQSPGSPQFVPPGSCIVLRTPESNAVWVTSWPLAQYVKHAWAGAWVNSLFRNESKHLASDLIRQAVAATRWYWLPPNLGLVTFVDPRHVKPTMRRGKPMWGYSYIKAGFNPAGQTKGGLLAFVLLPDDMPCPQPPLMAQLSLWEMTDAHPLARRPHPVRD